MEDSSGDGVDWTLQECSTDFLPRGALSHWIWA